MQLSRRQSSSRSAKTHYAHRPCADYLPVPLRPVNGATVSDYYGDSIPLDNAIRRESRLCAYETCGTGRCPFVPFTSSLPVPRWREPCICTDIKAVFQRRRFRDATAGVGFTGRTWVRQTQSHHTYRICEAATYISSLVPRFHWHATVPFGFRRQVSQHPRGDLLLPSPGSARNSIRTEAAHARHPTAIGGLDLQSFQ